MKRFYASTYVRYCIARIDKDGEIWYYTNASMHGKDKDGIIRIWNVKWEEYNSDNANYDRRERAEEILKGIIKYDYDKESEYHIVEVTTTTTRQSMGKRGV